MGTIYGFEQGSYAFDLFSLSHIVMILISIILVGLVFHFKETIRDKYKSVVTYGLIIVLVLSELSFHAWFIINDRWDLTINLPLQLCSISLYLCTFMLITKNYRLFEVAFFISMTGALVAIVTPELFFGYPHLRFFQFFIAHIAIVLACVYMLSVENYRPRFRSVIRSWVTLNVIAIFVYVMNHLVGSNYMFLMRKPSNASLIDYLGPYPWYILSLEFVAILLFVLIYLVSHRMISRS